MSFHSFSSSLGEEVHTYTLSCLLSSLTISHEPDVFICSFLHSCLHTQLMDTCLLFAFFRFYFGNFFCSQGQNIYNKHTDSASQNTKLIYPMEIEIFIVYINKGQLQLSLLNNCLRGIGSSLDK